MDTQSSLSRYEVLAEIGKGSYGVVYRAKDLCDDTIVAIKKIVNKDPKEGVPASIIREIGILKQMHHSNIVLIKDFFIESNNYYLVFEYLHQDLHHYLESLHLPLSEQVIKYYIHQLLLGLTYCHSNCILHRDLKPQNLLMSGEQLKIADFGLSRFITFTEAPVTPVVQTLWYRAPELLLGTCYSEKIDVWSVGCIFGEMINGIPIFPGANQVDQLWSIFKVLGTPDQKTWPEFVGFKGFNSFPVWQSVNFKDLFPVLSENGIDFIKKVLEVNPAKRITAHQALNHVYFREYNYVNNTRL